MRNAHRSKVWSASTLALGLLTLAAHGQTDVRYDFNHLNGDDTPDHTPLDGQDNWTAESFNNPTPLGVTATLGFDGTKALRYAKSGPGFGADASRLNDAAFSLPSFDSSQTRAYFEGDFGVGFWGNQLALAYDLDGNGQVRGAEAGELGPRLNIGSNDSVVGVMLVGAQGTKTMVPLATAGGAGGGDWIRLRLVMDLSANGGQGTGSVFYINLSAAGSAFCPVDGLQDIDLELDPSANDATNPALWNAIWLHMEGAVNQLDNFGAGTDALPGETYCTAKTLLICGPASIDAFGIPSASASSGFTVAAAPARTNRSGLMVYSDAGPAAIPFQGGFLCVNPAPLLRTVPTFSGGAATCDGVFDIDVNAFAAGNLGGNPAAFLRSPGARVNCQWWGRDSVATGSLLSDGFEYEVCP